LKQVIIIEKADIEKLREGKTMSLNESIDIAFEVRGQGSSGGLKRNTILDAIASNPGLAPAKLAELVESTPNRIYSHITHLKKAGRIYKDHNKGGWFIKNGNGHKSIRGVSSNGHK